MNHSPSVVSISLFFAVIAVTLGITYWAQKRSRTTSELYAAGGRIKAWQNGWAITGDLLSAGTFLGGIGMAFVVGYDAIIYALAPLVGFVVMQGLIAGPMRRLGRFTFVDAAAVRLSPTPIRIIGAMSALAVTLLYLIGQMLGVGGLVEIMFNVPYEAAVVLVGILMVIYVAFGGMLATTWVQLTKAVILVFGVSLLAVLALAQTNFSIDELYRRASAVHAMGAGLLQPGGLRLSPIESASLSIALIFGLSGMPHILMRFFTVPDAATARRSLAISLTIVGIVYYIVYFILGVAGVALLAGNPSYVDSTGMVQGGSNMVALHLARFLGGDVLFGLIAAMTFATILAVVAGLTVAAASAISYELYAKVIAGEHRSERTEKRVFRISTVVIGLLAIGLGIAFKGQNILFINGLVFSIAASACFPILVMAMYWRRLTTAGAVAGGAAGLVLSIGLIVLGPTVWVQVLGNAAPIVPLSQPAIISAPGAFLVMIAVSLVTRQAQEPAAPLGSTVSDPMTNT